MSPSRQYLLFILLSIAFGSCIGTKASFKSRKIDRLISKNEVLSQNFVGVKIVDLEKQKILYEKNSDKYFTPASNTKLLTFYVVTQVLQDSATALQYLIKGDSLLFWGTGDPTFLHDEFEYQPVLELLQDTSKKLFLYQKPTDLKRFGRGWAWDDYRSNYSAEKSAFPIYGNTCLLNYEDSTGVLSIDPPYFSKGLIVTTDTIENTRTLSREARSNTFTFLQKEGRADYSKHIPFTNQPNLIHEILSDTLHRKVESIDSLPDMEALSIKGYPMDTLYQRMLQPSDNFLAEHLIIMASYALFDTLSTDKILKYAQENWFADMPDKVRWVDGSGLSRYNLVTPRFMVALLDRLYDENDEDYLFEMLPTGGETGTLKNWYAGRTPYIHAKSGTLSNNYSLSGYLVTSKGRTLAFSIMTNHYMKPTTQIKSEIESLLEWVRDSY